MVGKGSSHRRRGISVVETLVASSIAAIGLAIAIPSFQGMAERRRVEGHAMQLSTDLQYARAEAVSRNRSVVFSVQDDGAHGCYVIHTGRPGECDCGGPSTVCSGDAAAIKTVVFGGEQRVRLDANVGAMRFDPTRGTVSPTGTLKITSADGPAIQHVVNIMGRVRSCSPMGSMPGYKPC